MRLQDISEHCSKILTRLTFGFDRRWLVHSIASYYGLKTWSVTIGDPARREAYVGIQGLGAGRFGGGFGELPRPLYVMV